MKLFITFHYSQDGRSNEFIQLPLNDFRNDLERWLLIRALNASEEVIKLTLFNNKNRSIPKNEIPNYLLKISKLSNLKK